NLRSRSWNVATSACSRLPVLRAKLSIIACRTRPSLDSLDYQDIKTPKHSLLLSKLCTLCHPPSPVGPHAKARCGLGLRHLAFRQSQILQCCVATLLSN